MDGLAALDDRDVQDAIQGMLQSRAEAMGYAGIVLGIIDGAGRRCILTCGDSGPNLPLLDGDSVFDIGSLTKTFTGVLLAEMVLRGDVRLDDPVTAYLPNTIRVPSGQHTPITLNHLATHTSGLPSPTTSGFVPSDWLKPYEEFTTQRLTDILACCTVNCEPGTVAAYSNIGMGLLGYALAYRAGMAYEDLLIQRILSPLGMTMTGYTITPAVRQHLVQGYSAQGAPLPTMSFTPVLYGAGGLHTSMNNLLTYLHAHTTDEATPLRAAFQLTQTPRCPGYFPQYRMGLGWEIETVGGCEIAGKHGGCGGYRSFTACDKDRRVAIAVLSNTVYDVSNIVYHLLDQQLPLAPPPPRPVETIPLTPTELDAFTGIFRFAPNRSLNATAKSDFTIVRDGDSLLLSYPGLQRCPFSPVAANRFLSRLLGAELEFIPADQGGGKSVVLHFVGQKVEGTRL